MSASDDCDCCAGTAVTTPAAIANPPALDAITHRTGTWAGFRGSLLARLSDRALPALAALRARDDDDFTIALIDGFAVMADVLTFYEERLANEAFLRTATERRSVLELAALLGYAPAPGVAADTWLAFTLLEAPGAPAQAALPVTIGLGTRVQSVPGPGETAQTFETVAAVQGRVELNALAAQTTAPQPIVAGLRELHLAGTGHRLASGDVILVVGAERASDPTGERWDVRLLDTVETDDARELTRVTWGPGLGHVGPQVDPAAAGVEVFAFRRRAALFGHNAPDARLLSTNGTHLASVADPESGEWDAFAIDGQAIDLDQAYEQVVPGSWVALADATIAHSSAAPLGYVELYRAAAVAHRSRSDYGLSSRVTHVDLDSDEHLDDYGLRTTLALVESERLPLAERPLRSPVYGDRVTLATRSEALAGGRVLAVGGRRQHVCVRVEATGLRLVPDDGAEVDLHAGDRLALAAAPARTLAGGATQSLEPEELLAAIDSADPASLTWALLDRDGRAGILEAGADALELAAALAGDEAITEIVAVADAADGVTHDRDRTTLRLAAALVHAYDRETVRINANVAPAGHGETVHERLGSGDASRPDQRFTLKQPPLTHVVAATPSGRRSTLAVRVAGTRWEERPSLFAAGPRDRVHTVTTGDDGLSTVAFGDGVEGARLPTGVQNVEASYRKGLGAAGNLRAGSLSTLLAGPLGVSAVTNPAPAAGGEDPEPLAAARRNAPRAVLTLDRAVSLQDYADFARGFAGIDKAHATWVGTGAARGVFITVAGAAGAAVEPSGTTHAGLLAALRSYGDPLLRTTVASFRPASFVLHASVAIAPDAVDELVLAAVAGALHAGFAFDVREFGQPVAIDEVVAVAHRVPGVLAVDVDSLRRVDQGLAPPVRPRLFAALPVVGAAGASAAELLTIEPAALQVEVMA